MVKAEKRLVLVDAQDDRCLSGINVWHAPSQPFLAAEFLADTDAHDYIPFLAKTDTHDALIMPSSSKASFGVASWLAASAVIRISTERSVFSSSMMRVLRSSSADRSRIE